MKIVFINTADIRGGASIFTNRLRVILTQRNGFESYYFVAYKDLDEPNVYATRGRTGELIEKVIDRISNMVGLQYQFFPFSTRFLMENIRRIKPDVISLNNTHGGYFQTNLVSKLGQIAPVVWTLHDMWSFTGNAAYTFGDESWKQMKNANAMTSIHPRIGINTGKWLLRQKARIYKRANLTIVTPSKWLEAQASQSPVFAGIEINQIYNGIDLDLFQPLDKVTSRKDLGLSPDASVLMFSAWSLKNNIWKGGEHLFKVLEKVNNMVNFKIDLLALGSGELPESLKNLSNFRVHQAGYVREEATMVRYYSASDVFVFPTKVDNLPTVLVEAMACALPCVTFDIGGCPEIVIHQQTGLIVPAFDLDAMAEGVVELLTATEKRRKMALQARIHAEKVFSREAMADFYIHTFEKAIDKRKNLQAL